MTAPVPSTQLEVEIAAWPYWSEPAFQAVQCDLERSPPAALGEKSAPVSDALMRYLQPRGRGMSLDVLRQFRDYVWFGQQREAGAEQGPALGGFLCSMAGRSLVTSGGQYSIQDTPPGIERHAARWRWLSLALPPDLLIAANVAGDETGRSRLHCDHVSLGAHHLGPFFEEEGVAQTHLHLGAAVPFEHLWTNLMIRIGADAPAGKVLESPAGTPFGSGEVYLSWLLTAALARVSLAAYLWRMEDRSVPHCSFGDFVEGLARRCSDNPGGHLEALAALRRGGSPPAPAVLRRILRQVAAPGRQRAFRSLEELRRADPLDRLWRQEHALPETCFLRDCLRHLLWERRAGARRPWAAASRFERVFWQYVRIRNRTYRHLVQAAGTAGLDWFSLHFQRIHGLRRGLDERLLMASALRLESRGPIRLRSLEVRTRPPGTASEVRRLVRAVAEASVPLPREPERGLVLHFLKEEAAEGGRRRHADPGQDAHGCRFGSYAYARVKEVRAIELALERHPELLVLLRGMDVASLELSVPTWVFGPAFERLRRSSRNASEVLAHHGVVPPFRFTMHAGEDFRRLAEGLRRIHEPIEYQLLQAGDRLGHAVALGVDPERWAASFPVIRQPAEERLDDLVWELGLYRRACLPANSARVESIRGELSRLSAHIYGNPIRSDELIAARALRHNAGYLEWLGFPMMGALARPVPPSSVARLLHRYLTERWVYLRGREPVEVEATALEVQMLRQVQHYLRSLIARRAMTVEANPTSNMLVGDLPLDAHPVFVLQPLPHARPVDESPVLVSLGDDDPVTFASCLPDEFCHVYYALLRRGVTAMDALLWLEQVRRNGMRARFTVPRYSVACEPRAGRDWEKTRRPCATHEPYGVEMFPARSSG